MRRDNMPRTTLRGATFVLAATLAVTASPATPIQATAPPASSTLAASQTVKVKLKKSWAVTKAKQ